MGRGRRHAGAGVGGDPTVLGPSSVPDWLDFPIVENLKQRLNIPIFLDNDATAGALGELLLGQAASSPIFSTSISGSASAAASSSQAIPYRGAFGMSGGAGTHYQRSEWPALLLRQSRVPGTLCFSFGRFC